MKKLFFIAMFLTIGTLAVPAYAACAAPVGVAGSWNFNPGKETYAVCDGTNWTNATATSLEEACAGTDSALEYDYTSHILKFCFTGVWFQLGNGGSSGACANEGRIEYIGGGAMEYCDGSNWQEW